MESNKPEVLPPPPNAIHAITAGFNAIANRLAVILFPIALDLFLWLGPRLRLDTLLAPLITDYRSSPEIVFGDMQRTVDMLGEINVFGLLHTLPLGVSSLLVLNPSPDTPFGPRQDIQIANWIVFLGTAIAFTLIGWLAGCFYYYAVARASLDKGATPSLAFATFHGVLLSLSWVILLGTLAVPALILLAVLALINPVLAILVYLVCMFGMLWLAVPIFFSIHGIFADARNAFISIAKSFRMLRFAMPSVGWFVILAIIISQGLNFLWLVPPTNSWMMLVGILGHAFVSTALLAASFIYYRELNTWIENALQWIKTQAGPARV